jgi:hypothetical protein
MKTLDTIYCLRIGLGLLAAVLCLVYGLATNIIPHNPPSGSFPVDWQLFFNTASIALLVYLTSYFVIKRFFLLKVEKPTKLLTTGIGVYFLSWICFWTLLYSIVVGQPTVLPA